VFVALFLYYDYDELDSDTETVTPEVLGIHCKFGPFR
jgi:hypothetical protein